MASQDNVLKFNQSVESLNKTLSDHIDKLQAAASNVAVLNASYTGLPSGYATELARVNKLNADVAKSQKQVAQSASQMAGAMIETVAASQKATASATTRKKLTDQEIVNNRILRTENQRLATVNSEVANAYEQLNAQMNLNIREAQGLAVQLYNIENGAEASEGEITQLKSRFDELTASVQRDDAALKSIDQTMGRNQRFVGQYERGFNGLSNSINQVTRELPAFTFSAQTGFLAISNNLPILVDEISKVRKETGSAKDAFTAVTGAVFSWQTLLSVGVTLLTIYGGKLVELASGLGAISDATKEAIKNQLAYNQAKVAGNSQFQNELALYRQYKAVATDANATDRQRAVAVDRIREMMRGYGKSLTDAQIQSKLLTQTEKQYVDALRARGQVQQRTSANDKTQERIDQLQAEIDARREYSDAIRQNYNDSNQYDKAAAINMVSDKKAFIATLKEERAQLELNEKIRRTERDEQDDKSLTADDVTIQVTINKLTEELSARQRTVNRLKTEAILLEETEEKKVRDKKIQYEELKDVVASRYAAELAAMEGIANTQRRIADNEAEDYSVRVSSAINYYDTRREMAVNASNEEIRVLKLSADQEIAEINRKVKDGTVTQSNAAAVILSIRQKLDNDILTSGTNLYYGLEQLANQEALDINKTWANLAKSIDNDTLANIGVQIQDVQKLSKVKGQYLDGQMRYIEVMRAAVQYEIASNETQKETLNIQLRQVQLEASRIPKLEQSSEKYTDLKQKELNITKQLADLDEKTRERQVQAVVSLREATRQYIDSFQAQAEQTIGFTGSLALLQETTYEYFNQATGQIEVRSGTMFTKLWDGAETTAQKFAIAFGSIGTIAQETFAFIQNLNAQSAENQTNLLRKQYELDLAFAGDNEAAKKQLEEDFEKRRIEIARRKAKADKDAAIFNASINIATGVTAALATGPAGIALAAAIAILGLAQIAVIASTPLPEFWKGTDNAPEGWASVDEKGRELHTDKHGNIKSWGKGRKNYRYLEQGDKIYTAAKTKKILDQVSTGAASPSPLDLSPIYRPEKQRKELTTDDIAAGVRRGMKGALPEMHQHVFDEAGYSRYTKRNNVWEKRLNNSRFDRGEDV